MERALFFEDLHEGDTYRSTGRTVTEADLVSFAGLSGDFNPLHVDAHAAADGRFGQRVPHGLLGIAIATGLLDRMGVFAASMIAMLEIGRWRFVAPVFVGDTVHLELKIESTRLTRSGSSGIVVRQIRLANQRGETLQEGTITVMVRCRNGASG